MKSIPLCVPPEERVNVSRHRSRAARRLLYVAIWALATSPIFACSASSSPPETPDGQFVGSYEEVIDLPSPAIPGFSDADFVQLLRPDDIPPIYHPEFVPADAANLPDDELVIGLVIDDDARAYPAGILFTREIINDTVAGVPVLVSWCPRCYTALVHDRRIGGDVPVFGNWGALYKGAMTWFDHETGSVWSQPLGAALAGPRAGTSVELIPSQLTTWGAWLESQPETTVLAVKESSPTFSGNRPGADHVVGLVIDDMAVAVPYGEIPPDEVVEIDIGDARVAVWRDPASSAIRAAELISTGLNAREIPVLIAYRSAWLKYYPGSVTEVDTLPPR